MRGEEEEEEAKSVTLTGKCAPKKAKQKITATTTAKTNKSWKKLNVKDERENMTKFTSATKHPVAVRDARCVWRAASACF